MPDVYYLFDKKISELRANGKNSTSRIYRDAINSLQRFKKRLYLIEVTPDFLQKYESKMLEEGKSITTISIYMRHMRCIYNQAIEIGYIDRKYYPFGRNKYQTKAPINIKKR